VPGFLLRQPFISFLKQGWLKQKRNVNAGLRQGNSSEILKPAVFQIFLHFLACAMLLFPCAEVFAQKEEYENINFQAFKSGKSVFIRFTIPSGRTCEGIVIHRAADGGDFIPIRKIEGICGSDSASITFSEEDKQPVFNQKLQYLLQLGRSAYSDTLNAFFTETGPAAYLLTKQPDGWKILFQNSTGELIRFLTYDLRGSIVMELETRENVLEIPEIPRLAGPLVFRLLHSKSGLMGAGKLFFVQ
jgi:hypothetical protein